MFAALITERDPLRWADLASGFVTWLHSAGGFASFGIVLFLLLGYPRYSDVDKARIPGWQKTFFAAGALLALLLYVAFGLTTLAYLNTETGVVAAPPWVGHLLTLASLCAVAVVAVPVLVNLTAVRTRRVFALAKLSFKEAVRRRVLYGFLFILLVFLFASWFIPSKPSDEVRTYVGIVFTVMTILLLFASLLISAFSIPADIRQQTIHTIVTKPVERFEIVLGRFLGFLGLMTVVLAVLTGLCLLYVLRGIHPEAAAESLKARVPVFGELRFENTDDAEGRKGVNVGREWDYRSYISKPLPGQPPQMARWDFAEVPAALGGRDNVRCEYSFDIYRTTKGDEGRDVYCTFRFYTWRFQKGNEEKFRTERNALRKEGKADADINQQLASKYGFFEIDSQPVTDYRTLSFVLPGALFQNLLAADPEAESELKSRGEVKVPLRIRVLCDSPTQYVGMAKRDLYLRLDDSGVGSDTAGFCLNFFKGAFGLWLQLALLIGLAVAMSTYLNGVVTLLVTAVLFVGGYAREFVQSVALGQNPGGGPVEAMVRMTRRELTGPSMSDSASLGDQIVSKSDAGFRFVMRMVIDVIPDVNQYDVTKFVAEGFNISGELAGMSFLHLFGYLACWMVLAYYLIHWREVANPN
jgi:hypothetical protein